MVTKFTKAHIAQLAADRYGIPDGEISRDHYIYINVFKNVQ